MKTQIGLLLTVASIILGNLVSGDDSMFTFAQNATGNATATSNTAGTIIEGQSATPQFPSVICTATKDKVPTLGISISPVNTTGDLDGWWNIPGSGSGNNTGGVISSARVNNKMYEIKGTMNYDFLCAQKDDLNYEISITGKCGLETIIRYKSNNEVFSHDFIGHVKC